MTTGNIGSSLSSKVTFCANRARYVCVLADEERIGSSSSTFLGCECHYYFHALHRLKFGVTTSHKGPHFWFALEVFVGCSLQLICPLSYSVHRWLHHCFLFHGLRRVHGSSVQFTSLVFVRPCNSCSTQPKAAFSFKSV